MAIKKEEVLERLDFQAFYQDQVPGFRAAGGDEIKACCPFHDDSDPSLYANTATGLFNCQGCGEKGDVFSLYQRLHQVDFKEALEALAKFAGVNGNGAGGHAEKKPEQSRAADEFNTGRYDYRNAEGGYVFSVVRFEEEGKTKTFRQWRYDFEAKSWVKNVQGIVLVPYRLPEVLKAETVYCVEGEKDADALVALGLTATCNPQGAGKWRDSYSPFFKNKHVVILPDNDEPGRKHVQDVREKLLAHAVGVRVVHLPGLPPKGDVSDWITAGGTADELQRIVAGVAEETCAVSSSSTVSGAAQQKQETIKIEDGKNPEVVDRCEELLMRPDLAPEHRIFQRGGQLVRIASLPSSGFHAGVDRPQGAVMINAVNHLYLQDILGRLARFRRYDARLKGFKNVDVPKALAETLLARVGLWRFPSLRGVILCPTIRADGSILAKEGYDDHSGFYLASTMQLNVPDVPTRDEARSALESLNTLLTEFPFVSEVDRAVALSLILSGIARPAVENVPLFTTTSPVRGSGKSTLTDIAAVLATGRRSAVVAAVMDPQELRKRLEACLLAGDSMVSLDNLNGVLNSDLLCQATTQAAVKIRPLGVSTQQEVPNTAVFCANGNNLVVAGDLSRRTLMCKLDPNCERPEEREFESDPVAQALRRRAGYVEAALILLRAYVAAGSPALGLSKFGSFEAWSDLVRSALVWAGAADPCESRAAIIGDDPELAALEAVLGAWSDRFGSKPMSVQEIANEVAQDENTILAECVADIASNERGFINKQKLGLWCRRIAGRIAGGRRLQRSTLPGASAHWRVVNA